MQASNPEVFELFSDVGASMPPTPVSRNLYKVNCTPESHFKKALKPLAISNVANFR